MPPRLHPSARRVQNYIRELGLVSGGETVLVAVSGGPDSVCLLHILHEISEDLAIKLQAAHLDHGLRGAESAADARYVDELTRKLNIPSIIETREVTEWSGKRKPSSEEAAREVRYRFLEEAAKLSGATRVAIGHTRDDQVETVLLHYLRGSGISGLRGLRPAASLPYSRHEDGIYVIRPLLNIGRQETLEYCSTHELRPCTDSSNLQTGFLRNRVRLELLPLLRQYNPDVDGAVLRLSSLAGDDASFLDEQAVLVFNQSASRDGNLTCLDPGKLRGIPMALQRRVFRISLEQAYGTVRDVEAQHVEALVGLLFGTTGKRIQLPGGVTAVNERSRIVISEAGSAICPWPALSGTYRLNVPGETCIPGWRVTADIIAERFFRDDDIFSASFDLAKMGDLLSVRGRQHGDRFQPLGLSHSRKIQDFMVDAAIPKMWRDSVPLVWNSSHIAWVVGWRMDDRVKVTASTEQVLRLEFHRQQAET